MTWLSIFRCLRRRRYRLDQRGVARVVDGTVDIGAFESRNFTIAITGGTGQSTTVDTGFLNPLVVTVTSAYGDPVQGGMVAFAVPADGASATFSANGATAANATIDPAGQAAVGVKANTVAGTYGVMANARGAAFAAGFSLTNTSGAAYQITPALRPSGLRATVGYAFTGPLQVTVTDEFGNAVAGVRVTYFAPSSGPSGTVVGGASVTTDAQGIVAPTFLANTVAGGAYAVTATAVGLLGSPVSFNLINTPDVAREFVVTGFPSPVAAGVANTFTVSARDEYGNVATAYSGLVHFNSTDPQAILPADAALSGGTGTFTAALQTSGNESITAADTQAASLTGTETGIMVNPAAASKLRIAAPSRFSPGVPFNFAVTAVDAFGNVAVGYAGTISFLSSAKNTVLPGDAVLSNGTGTFTATFNAKADVTMTVVDIASPRIRGLAKIVVDSPTKIQSAPASTGLASLRKGHPHPRRHPSGKPPIAVGRGRRSIAQATFVRSLGIHHHAIRIVTPSS